jgi:hypothetical protein
MIKNPEDAQNYYYNRGIALGQLYTIFNIFGFEWFQKGTPSLDDIDKELRRLEEDLLKNPKADFIATGRLKVSISELNKNSWQYEYDLELL